MSAYGTNIKYVGKADTKIIHYSFFIINYKKESVGKPSSVADGYLSRRGIAPSAQAAFRNTPGRRIVTVSVAPNRVYRVLPFP